MQTFLREVFENVYLAIIVQLMSRLIVIYVDSYAATVDPNNQEQIGIVNMRILLLEVILALLSKEAIRRACLRKVRDNEWTDIVNMMWLILPLSAAISLPLCFVWIKILDPPPSSLFHSYKYAVFIVAGSCVMEKVAEVPNLAARAFFFNRFRNILNLLYIICHSTVMYFMLRQNPGKVIDAFSNAHLIGHVFWVCGLYGFFYCYLKTHDSNHLPFDSIKQFLPTYQQPIPDELWDQAWGMSGTILLNHLLLEGEHYVLTVTHALSFYDQGLFYLVESLGSLPTRLVLRPLGDNYLMYFAPIFKGQSVPQAVTLNPQEKHYEIARVIYCSCRAFTCLGLLLTTYILCYGGSLLRFYGGDKLNVWPAFILLFVQGLAFTFYAVQTLTDSFMLGTANPSEIQKYNKFLVGVLIMHWIVAWSFTKSLGAYGLPIASCICIGLRILWGISYMRGVFTNSDMPTLSGLIPSIKTYIILIIYIAISLTLQQTELKDCQVWIWVFLGGCFTLVTVYSIVKFEPSLNSFVTDLIQSEPANDQAPLHHVD